MQEVEVESKVIRGIAYDAQAQTCDVRFTSGRVYRYVGVPASLVQWWLRSPEKGAFFNRKVRDVYPYSELPTGPPVAEPDLTRLLEASLKGEPDPE